MTVKEWQPTASWLNWAAKQMSNAYAEMDRLKAVARNRKKAAAAEAAPINADAAAKIAAAAAHAKAQHEEQFQDFLDEFLDALEARDDECMQAGPSNDGNDVNDVMCIGSSDDGIVTGDDDDEESEWEEDPDHT